MIYIILLVTVVINVFNLLLISSRNLINDKKEKILLVTYSIAELIYLFYILSLIEYTAVNLILGIACVCIWLLSKAYISVNNIKFEEVEYAVEDTLKINDDFEKNIIENNNIELNDVEAVNSELMEKNIENLEESKKERNSESINEDKEFLQIENNQIELSDIIDNISNSEPESKYVQNSLNELSNIIQSVKNNEEKENIRRRRSLALKVSKVDGYDKNFSK